MVVLTTALSLLRGRLVTPATPSWALPKDPISTVVRLIDFSAVLCGRSITGVSYGASGVDVVGASVQGALVLLVLQGGVDGVPGRIEVRAICSDGTDETTACLLPIVASITLPGSESMPANLITTTVGTTGGLLGPVPVICPAGSSVVLTGSVIARDTASGDTTSWDVRAVVKGCGTLAAAVDSQSVTQFQADGGLAACTLAVSASGGSIYMIVIGVAGLTLAWSGGFSWSNA